MPPVEGLSGGASPVGTPNHAWLSLDLYLTLDGWRAAAARRRRARGARVRRRLGACPDVVALGAAAAMAEEPAAAGGVLADVMANAIAAYLSSRASARATPPPCCTASGRPGRGVRSGRWRWRRRTSARAGPPCRRILDVCQDLKALSAALDGAPHALAGVALAACGAPCGVPQPGEVAAGARGGERRAIRCGVPAIPARARHRRRRGRRRRPARPSSPWRRCAIFFKTLHAGAGGLPPDLRQELRASRRRRRARRPTRRRGGGDLAARRARCAAAARGRRRPRAGPRAAFGRGRRGGGQRQLPAALLGDADGGAAGGDAGALSRAAGRRARARRPGAWCTTCSTSTASSPGTRRAAAAGRGCGPPSTCSCTRAHHAARRVALRLGRRRKPFGTKPFAGGLGGGGAVQGTAAAEWAAVSASTTPRPPPREPRTPTLAALPASPPPSVVPRLRAAWQGRSCSVAAGPGEPRRAASPA